MPIKLTAVGFRSMNAALATINPRLQLELMEKSKTKLRKWFLAIFLVSHTSHGTNAVELSAALNVTYKTAWLILHKIRRAMRLADMNHLLTGV